MTRSKHRSKSLGVCILAALGLLAFAAASAQAQTGWLVNKAFTTSTKKVHASVHPLADGKKHLALLAEFGVASKVEILCETLVIDDGLYFAGEGAEGRATLLLSTCETFINKVKSIACKPKEPLTATTKLHAILHTKGDKKTYLLGEPEVKGNPFMTLEVGEECAFGAKVEITGDLVAECLNEKLEKNTAGTDYCLEDMVHHLIQEAPKKLFELGEGTGKFHELLFGARSASLEGIVDTLLTEPLGGTWAVHI